MSKPPLTTNNQTQYWIDSAEQQHRMDGPSSVGLSTQNVVGIQGIIMITRIPRGTPFSMMEWTAHGQQLRVVGRDFLTNDDPKLVDNPSTFMWSMDKNQRREDA